MKTLKHGDIYACGPEDTPDEVMLAAARRHAALLATPAADRHADQFRLGQFVTAPDGQGEGQIVAIDACDAPGRLRIAWPDGRPPRWFAPAVLVVT